MNQENKQVHVSGPRTVKIWTFQNRVQWRALQHSGSMAGDWTYVPIEDHVSYRYMCKKMQEHELRCGDRPPIWGWHSCGGHQQPPDADIARQLLSDHQLADGQVVLLSLECPAAAVLVSDYNAWCELVYFSAGLERCAGLDAFSPVERFEVCGDEDLLLQATLPMVRREWVVQVRKVLLTESGEASISDEITWE